MCAYVHVSITEVCECMCVSVCVCATLSLLCVTFRRHRQNNMKWVTHKGFTCGRMWIISFLFLLCFFFYTFFFAVVWFLLSFVL